MNTATSLRKETSKLKHYSYCRICLSKDIDTVVRLAPTPPADMFLPEKNKKISDVRYPLDVGICLNCSYLHLRWVLSPEIVYPEFSYLTASTVGLIQHYDQYVRSLSEFVELDAGDLIVDIGSNDGSFLKAFESTGARILGVEPSNEVAKIANLEVPTICGFFDSEVTQKIISSDGRASVVTANYMYANVENILEFTRNIKELMAKEGLFIVQTGYHPDQMKLFMFDYIYHEHLSYFSVSVLDLIFRKCGLELIHVERNDMKGGSIRVVGQHSGGKRRLDDTVGKFLSDESSGKFDSRETYRAFDTAVQIKGQRVNEMLSDLVANGKRIVGYGASHSTTTLIYHFGIGKYLEYLVDDNELKHSCVSPGLHIPVFPSAKICEDCPDYVLVLAWQHGASIIERNRQFIGAGGKFVLPLPELRVI